MEPLRRRRPAVCVQGVHNKAVLTYMLPTLRGNGQANRDFGVATKLHTALLDVLPLHFGAVAATDSPVEAPTASVPAQVNLASSMLVNGQPLAALRLVAPVCRAAWGLPDGTVIKAFCVAVEAQVQLHAFQVS
jgi:hypothetical protein